MQYAVPTKIIAINIISSSNNNKTIIIVNNDSSREQKQGLNRVHIESSSSIRNYYHRHRHRHQHKHKHKHNAISTDYFDRQTRVPADVLPR